MAKEKLHILGESDILKYRYIIFKCMSDKQDYKGAIADYNFNKGRLYQIIMDKIKSGEITYKEGKMTNENTE